MPIPVPGRTVEALRRSTLRVLTGAAAEGSSGSGVVLTDSQVITNAHVVKGRSTHVQAVHVESWEGDRLNATLLDLDPRRDLALLSVPGLKAPSASLGDSRALRPGVPVIAVGNPLGFLGAVSSGVVHSVEPSAALGGLTAILADVQLAPGNSGGPLAGFDGQIIGVNTMVIGGRLALAIPSRTVQSFLKHKTSRSSLGLVVRPVRLKDRSFGMMILQISRGGAAERASLLPGDVLIGAGGIRFQSVEDLEAVSEQQPGTVIPFEFYRAGQRTIRRVALLVERRPLSSAA